MPRYARFNEFQEVRLKRDSTYNFGRVSRVVTTRDRGIVVDVHNVEQPGYEVEFHDDEGNPLAPVTLREDEVEAWE